MMRRTIVAALAAVALTAAPAAAQIGGPFTWTASYHGCSSFGSCHTVTLYAGVLQSWGQGQVREWRIEGLHVLPASPDPARPYGVLLYTSSLFPLSSVTDYITPGTYGGGQVWGEGTFRTLDYSSAFATNPLPATFGVVVAEIPPGCTPWLCATSQIPGRQTVMLSSTSLTAVPEPATIALTAGGLLALGGLGTLRRRRA